jgi:hypothetical protein
MALSRSRRCAHPARWAVPRSHAAERESPGNRLERLDADGDADHSGLAAAQRSISSLPHYLTMRAFDSVYLAVLVLQDSCEGKSGFFAG